MMKILFLNPHIDAEHKVIQALEAAGMAAIVVPHVDDAWQALQLHGKTIDVAIIHREGMTDSEEGLKFVRKAKADALQSDLPIIVTSSEWDEPEFSTHQAGSEGANAYLRWPFAESRLLEVIEALFGSEAPAAVSPPSLDIGEAPVFVDAPVLVLPTGDSAEITSEPPELLPESLAESLAEPSLSALELGTFTAGPTTGPEEAPISFNGEFSAEQPVPENDQELAAEMPYLFSSKLPEPPSQASGLGAALVFAQPVGDAVVPGGAAQSPDVETLKKYLLLREQDVAVLSTQLKSAQEQLASLELQLKTEKAQNIELSRTIEDQRHKIDDFERDKELALDSFRAEATELRFELKARTDKARLMESQVRDATEEIERLKDRVRLDIRKIRVREKELENKLEIMKKDSEALIAARENKIIELKRKVDTLEFNMDLLQDQYQREKETSGRLREKLARAAQVVRVAGGLLDSGPAAKGAQPLEESAVQESGEYSGETKAS